MSMIEPRRDALGRRVPDELHHYTDAQKAEAVALAMTVGDEAAAAQLGIPRRNLSRWRRTPNPVVQVAIVASEKAIADKLLEVVGAGTEAMLRRVRDPKSRLGDIARAVDVAANQHNLLTGRATSRTEATVTAGPPGLSEEERADLRLFIDTVTEASDAEIAEWLAGAGSATIREIRDAERSRRPYLPPLEVSDGG